MYTQNKYICFIMLGLYLTSYQAHLVEFSDTEPFFWQS